MGFRGSSRFFEGLSGEASRAGMCADPGLRLGLRDRSVFFGRLGCARYRLQHDCRRRAQSLLGPLADKVHQGDFFEYPLGEMCFDIIYERTFLCTFPSEFWPRYAQRIVNLVAPAGILCGFFFMGPEDEPPPYPISQVQLDELLGGWFQHIEDKLVEDSLPLFAGKERWQIWRRK